MAGVGTDLTRCRGGCSVPGGGGGGLGGGSWSRGEGGSLATVPGNYEGLELAAVKPARSRLGRGGSWSRGEGGA